MDPTQDTDEIRGLLGDSAERALSQMCTKEIVNAAEAGIWPTALWEAMEELGYPRATLPESAGGSAIDLSDALWLTRVCASHALPLPLGETMLASWLLHAAGLAVPDGPLGIGPADRSSTLAATGGTAPRLAGRLRNLPWGGSVNGIAAVVSVDGKPSVVLLDPREATMRPGTNLAGEERCTLDFDGVPLAADKVAALPAGLPEDIIYLLGAALRSQQIAGGLAAARDLAVRYCGERIAFGAPLNRLQAVRQNLAVLAGAATAAMVAADMALDALGAGSFDALEGPVGLAKIRAGEAVGTGAGLAHQLHGAIGFTYEHRLHHFTRRMWSWRDEFGSESYWSGRVGCSICDAGAPAYWTTITEYARL